MPHRTITVPAFDRGTYLHTGFSQASNEAYFLRWNDLETPNEQVRSFFAFDLAELRLDESERVVGVALNLQLPKAGYMTPNDRERVSVHAVPSDLTEYVLRGGKQPQLVFGILGGGELVSEAFVSKVQEESSVPFLINDHGRRLISDVVNRADRRWILGARLQPWGPRAANRRLFMGTLNLPPHTVNLEFDVESL